MNEELVLDILSKVVLELRGATQKFGAFHNAHEGYAVLLEEVDELWDAVKLKQNSFQRNHDIRAEAVQVAAMAIRVVMDCCSPKLPQKPTTKFPEAGKNYTFEEDVPITKGQPMQPYSGVEDWPDDEGRT